MTKFNTVVAVLVTVLIALGLNIWITVRNANGLGKEFSIVCVEHRAIARIAREEAEESALSNRNLLPRVSIPGISHKELVESTDKKQEAQLRHAAEYALIQKETC